MDMVRINAVVILFTCAVALATAVLAGLAPTLSVRIDLMGPLRSGGQVPPGRPLDTGAGFLS